MLLPLVAAVLKAIGLTQPHIGDGHTRRQVPHLWLFCEMACYFDTIHLHHNIVIRTIRWPLRPVYGSTTARPADGSQPSEPGFCSRPSRSRAPEADFNAKTTRNKTF